MTDIYGELSQSLFGEKDKQNIKDHKTEDLKQMNNRISFYKDFQGKANLESFHHFGLKHYQMSNLDLFLIVALILFCVCCLPIICCFVCICCLKNNSWSSILYLRFIIIILFLHFFLVTIISLFYLWLYHCLIFIYDYFFV